ncbi:MAG: hypothetical protein WC850_03520 [Candidatus Gracilibacteria bacterium]
MKKFFLITILIISSLFYSDIYAGTIKVRVPSKVPGVDCTVPADALYDIKTQLPMQYECTVETGFGSINKGIGQIIKYFTFITGLAGVLYIIVNGIMLSMAGLNEKLKEDAKNNIQKTILGLILLLLSGLFLNFIAPWVYA